MRDLVLFVNQETKTSLTELRKWALDDLIFYAEELAKRAEARAALLKKNK